MSVFSPLDREGVRDYIISLCHACEHIVALVAVGSGAYGYTDELSDLDFVIALDHDDNMETVMYYVSDKLKEQYQFLYFKQAPERRLQVYLCDNYLEIDIGYGAYTRAAAFRPHWKVLFDKSGTVHDAMQRSWERIQNTPNTASYERALAECANTAWYYMMEAATAIKRGRHFHAAAVMELARKLYIDVLGCRYGVDTNKGKDLDSLPTSVLDDLQHTLVFCLESDALWQSLLSLVDVVYTELEQSAACVCLNRSQLLEYIQICREV